MKAPLRLRMAAPLLAAALLPVFAAPALAADPSIPFERFRLAGGLEVVLARDNSVPLVAVDVWYHVGSGDETPGKSGFAHLFEHMMFQGTEHTGEDAHFEILKKIGASEVNGSTNGDRTNYYEVVPANQLETALWLESDRMGYMLPLLNDKSLANQRDVVRNERRQRYDNVPYGKDRFAVSAALYPEGHPYRYLTIGLHEDLEKASAEDVRAFFQKWYVPANATLVVAGDFEPAEAKKLVEKWFGTFPASVKPSHPSPEMPKIEGAKSVAITDDFARLRRIHYAWHTPRAWAPGDAELDVVGGILSNEGTGRLYKILVHEKQLAQTVQAYEQTSGHSSSFHVVVDLLPDADQAEVARIVDAELDRLAKEPPSAKEVARIVTSMESGKIFGLEGLMARAETLQSCNHWTGDPGCLAKELEMYRAVTPEAVRATTAKWLRKDARVEIVTTPSAGAPPKGSPAPATGGAK